MSFVAAHDRIRKGGAVRRWHTQPVHSQQTVAAHSWGVAMLLREIVASDKLTVNLLMAGLDHDVPEYDTGDTPANAKWRSKPLTDALNAMEQDIELELGIVHDLNEYETLMLRAADIMELLWFCIEERRLGNTTMDDVFDRALVYTRRLLPISSATPYANGVSTEDAQFVRPDEWAAMYQNAHRMLQHIIKEYNHVRK